MRPGRNAPPADSSSALWWVVGLLAIIAVVSVVLTAVMLLRSENAPSLASPGASTASPALAAVRIDGGFDASASAPSPSASATSVAAPLSDAELDELAGNYTCKIDDTASFPCRIADGTLEKLAGSQRFKGSVSKLGNGNIGFTGTFFCPFGDCTRPVATTFVRQGPGHYVGKFGPNSIPGATTGGERVVLTKVR